MAGVRVRVSNKHRGDHNRVYYYSTVLDYALSERETFDVMASEELGVDVELDSQEIEEAVDEAYRVDLNELFPQADELSNDWKRVDLIDFDDSTQFNDPNWEGSRPYFDIPRSMYNALAEGWIRVAKRQLTNGSL